MYLQIREELMALHNTRLYKAGGGRKHKDSHSDGVALKPESSHKPQEKTKASKVKHTEL